MDTGMKEGTSVSYNFIFIPDYESRLYIEPGDKIERVNYNDIKDSL